MHPSEGIMTVSSLQLALQGVRGCVQRRRRRQRSEQIERRRGTLSRDADGHDRIAVLINNQDWLKYKAIKFGKYSCGCRRMTIFSEFVALHPHHASGNGSTLVAAGRRN